MGLALGMATGLFMGSVFNSDNTTAVLPRYVLIIISKTDYNFNEQIRKDLLVGYEKVEEKTDYPYRYEVTTEKFRKTKFYVNRIEREPFTYLAFTIKESDGSWIIDTFNLLRKLLAILTEKKIKFEVYQ